MSFVTLWVLGFLEVLQPVSVESPNTVSGRYAYARDPLQLDRFTDASSPSSGSVPRYRAGLSRQRSLLHTRSGIRFLCPYWAAVWLSDGLCCSGSLQSSTRNQ